MGKNRTNISKASTYKDIGDFWDNHDLGDYAHQGREVDFDVTIESEVTYYPVEKNIVKAMQAASRKHGVPSDTLVNMWLKEKLREENTQ